MVAAANSYDYQKKERLVYCNLLEHLLLHIKIGQDRYFENHETMQGDSSLNELITHGVNMLSMQINRLYEDNGSDIRWEQNLSSFQRLLILTMLIDYNICTKDQIISLLNYHIRMREKQDTDKFNLAISKWEEDRDYIERYRVGEFRKVYVNSISRRR